MTLKKSLLIALVLAVLFGCGGGGGSTTGGGSTGTIILTRAEAVSASDISKGRDPLNIQVGEQVRFQIVQYDNLGTRYVRAAGEWTTTDVNSNVGELDPNGTFSATANSFGVQYVASAEFEGQSYGVTYKVLPVQARVDGTVRVAFSTKGIRDIRVLIVNSSGVVVGSARTDFDGYFNASVPTSGTRFILDPETIDPALYYRSFTYGGLRYSATIETCTAPLPTLVNGTTAHLSGFVVVAPTSATPPGPPTGCPF